jgi:signal transduction histidine kinase
MDNSCETKPFKLKEFIAESLGDRGNWAFTATVLAGYLSLFLSSHLEPVRESLPLLIGLGILYWLLGIFGFGYLDYNPSPWLTAAYFAAMLGLGFLITHISEVSGFVVIINLPIIAHAVVRLKLWGVLLVGLALLIGFGSSIAIYADGIVALQAVVSSVSGLVFIGIFTHVAISAERARQEVQRLATELTTANQKLREYAAQVEELATTNERNRIAREIHDGLGHYLTVINMQIQAARAVQDTDPARASEAMGKAGAMAQEALADVRRSVAALRASPTGNKPITEFIQGLAAETRAAGIQTSVVVQGTPQPLSPQADLTLYRAAQEALTNIRKHAHASAVNITLNYDNGSVKLLIKDNGVGTSMANNSDGGFGLIGVRERTQLLNGQVAVNSAPGEGFALEVTLPVIN